MFDSRGYWWGDIRTGDAASSTCCLRPARIHAVERIGVLGLLATIYADSWRLADTRSVERRQTGRIDVCDIGIAPYLLSSQAIRRRRGEDGCRELDTCGHGSSWRFGPAFRIFDILITHPGCCRHPKRVRLEEGSIP